jgi:hypothetical protein
VDWTMRLSLKIAFWLLLAFLIYMTLALQT